MRFRILFACAFLAGCATDTSTCPEPVSYTQDEKTQAADQMVKADADGNYPMLLRMMGDYKAERAQLRACFN